ncbi:hypothetical protein V6N12_052462 [Hibiscus sabdariffa]|uniref:Uncharacterized protein n=1 Tax=Hibiscus sabdariffa TaxID=183260 RepID=A0ABR2C2A0_9ROSI
MSSLGSSDYGYWDEQFRDKKIMVALMGGLGIKGVRILGYEDLKVWVHVIAVWDIENYGIDVNSFRVMDDSGLEPSGGCFKAKWMGGQFWAKRGQGMEWFRDYGMSGMGPRVRVVLAIGVGGLGGKSASCLGIVE